MEHQAAHTLQRPARRPLRSARRASRGRATGLLTPGSGDALIVVDVQNDFLPGGALAVAHGDEVIGPLNRYLRQFARAGLPVFVTRDWHPRRHCSFTGQGGPWPPHCVARSRGAAFAPALRLPPAARVISKATRASADAYSGFQGTRLAPRLRRLGCRRVFVGGLATDYCVRATVRDALAAGFEVVVLGDAVRAVNVRRGDGARALADMREHGAVIRRAEAGGRRRAPRTAGTGRSGRESGA